MEKSPIQALMKPVSRFVSLEFTGGIVLFTCVIIALVWANSPWAQSYHDLWEMNFSIGLAGTGLNGPLHVWVNDGLMALFFFVIGLELKREFIAGELSTLKKASLPMVAAMGGMLVPAAIYAIINYGHEGAKGWGIPMATDIAFALALLSLAGKHIPTSVKVFLSALAVADDLGAVLVIAFFYTPHIDIWPLLFGFGTLAIIFIGNMLGARSTMFYLILGIAVWVGFLLSGVHATIAGVLVAFMIPARTKINEKQFVKDNRKLLVKFETAIPIDGSLVTPEQHTTIEEIKNVCLDAETPLQKIEYGLHPWVAFLIMPLFALVNAGMHIGADFFQSIANPVSIGVAAGLIIGKFFGIMIFTWVMVHFRLARLPRLATWKHIRGVAMLAGVGFTMSLFITGLAFDNQLFTDQSKYGILIASLLAGTLGLLMLKKSSNSKKPLATSDIIS